MARPREHVTTKSGAIETDDKDARFDAADTYCGCQVAALTSKRQGAALEIDPFCPAVAFPRTYFVPRFGRLECVVAKNADHVRILRTELELLRGIRRRIARGSSRGVDFKHRFSIEKRRELAAIVRDAFHPLVDAMIRTVDRDFGALRKEIMMSVVNEEAGNIVQEAIASGAIPTGESTPNDAPTGVIPESLDQALAEAEAALSEAAGLASTVADPDALFDASPETTEARDATADTNDIPADITDGTDANPFEPPAAEGTSNTNDASIENTQEASAANSEEPSFEQADGLNPSDTTDDGSTGQEACSSTASEFDEVVASQTQESDQDTDACHTFEQEANESSPTAHATENTDNASEAQEPGVPSAENDAFSSKSSDDFTAERAQQAVTEIESGIRRLANVLSTEVSQQWKQAQEVINDTASSREQVTQVHREAKVMLEEIKHLREEAAIARDAANLARREANLFRDNARQGS